MLRIPTASVLIAAFALISSASAQSWPQRPVNVMVPFAPGNSPEEFAAMISADIALWAEAAKRAGVQDK